MNSPLSGKSPVKLKNKVRFITATSLFDGHDAAINIMRRIMQSQGAEVIHLGHDRSVEEIVTAAIQEDVQGIAVSSYQGGHMEFFRYMVDLLRETGSSGGEGSGHIQVFAGGGGVIIPAEIQELTKYGVNRVYSPDDGRELGLEGMIADMLKRADFPILANKFEPGYKIHNSKNVKQIAQNLSWIEQKIAEPKILQNMLAKLPDNSEVPVIGLTGTGGAGKSCLTDEFVRNFLEEFPDKQVAIISVDPSKRKTGGALLGDRMRMNSINDPRVFMRSMATRRSNLATSAALDGAVRLLRTCAFDLIFVETAGIGQSDSEIADFVDLSLYVMTPEYGAATQLEKIDMIDFADCIVINKFDKPGAEDALLAVRKQYRRSRNDFDAVPETMPVFGVVANRFNDSGTNWLYHKTMDMLIEKKSLSWKHNQHIEYAVSEMTELIPADRKEYLRQISSTVRNYKKQLGAQTKLAAECGQLYGTLQQMHGESEKQIKENKLQSYPLENITEKARPVAELYNKKLSKLPETLQKQLRDFEQNRQSYLVDNFQFNVREKVLEMENHRTSLSGLKIPKIATPKFEDWGEISRWLGLENFPGSFPFTAGVFPFKREGEDPTRMFAGEGIAERTNRRFHLLAHEQPATRLSTAFDSVTLYGSNPHSRPDIYGKIGNAGVSICTVDDAKRLYSGFDLLLANTSVSMTINGPAPIILAFFMNAAIDQQVEKHLRENGRLEEAKKTLRQHYLEQDLSPPEYRMELPKHHNGLGLDLLGISAKHYVDKETYGRIKDDVLNNVRGTVQADILKEDQAQNTCIFSTNFALRMMGDIQEYFTANDVRNFYSVSISGYHIAEAGANPISQVAFTLANGFTLIEYYLARGLAIDDFARNLSFFFSNGMDPEYAVIGRVARRIFAVTLRDLYGANERSQKLKYHIQTSGRSLHAMEMDFNDIRTTLQALYAVYDNCNSLHTNAYDEAITTPTGESVRRALAIQLIINHELGQAYNHNPLQGSFLIEELTELVEEAILSEFVRISERGGVLGAMETMYQRNKIQEESLYYETLKHSGELPIMGVNTFLNPNPAETQMEIELARSTDAEKDMQIRDLENFQQFHSAEQKNIMERLRQVALNDGNIFELLMDAVQVASLGEITQQLYQLGGKYRRNM
ncbi:MAG: methylmalonyl-CoA mutase family protein [SAR324 cluster bacterium]|nr:methylmalonyl-CoA mutase family protein [SAR324 cluster bacterium]MBL7035223.1 methylmalonyl-CoA mutase family protein [SAR324 cluster bacterium]